VMSMCDSASVCLSLCSHNSKIVQPNFTIFVHVAWAVARSSSDGVVIRYVFPLLRMTSCFHTNGRTALDKIRLQDRLTSSTLPKPPIPSVTSDSYSVW